MQTQSYVYEALSNTKPNSRAGVSLPPVEVQQPRPNRRGLSKIGLSIMGVLLGLMMTLSGVTKVINAFSIAPAISRVEMARGLDSQNRAKDVTSSFRPGDEKIHCVVTLSSSPPGTRVKVAWTFVDGPGQEPNQNLGSQEVTLDQSNNVGDFYLTSSSGFPVGNYRADVYVSDKFERTCTFRVQ